MSTATNGPLHDLTGFQRDTLAMIASLDEPKGLEIKRELEAAYETNEINHGRLYPNLDTLVNKGFVAKGEKDARTNFYEITSRGERELAAHIKWQTAMIGGQA